MNPLRPTRTVATLGAATVLALGLLTPTLGASAAPAVPTEAAPAASTFHDGQLAARRGPSISVSPKVAMSGQGLIWSGNIGVRGVRKVHLQHHMNRPGDIWRNISRSTFKTKANGSFRFNFPAPSMWGISLRVVSGKYKTRGIRFDYKITDGKRYDVFLTAQDLVASATTNNPQLGVNQVLTGRKFDLNVNTHPTMCTYRGEPDCLRLRPDMDPTKIASTVVPGRALTLQKRVGMSWVNEGQTAVADSNGKATFVLTAQDQPGTTVYRVRAEDVRLNGRTLAWNPSFPVYVEAYDKASDAPAPFNPFERSNARAIADSSHVFARSAGESANAGGKLKWGRPKVDFDWEVGESLTAPPRDGKVRTGKWIDSSDGTGRASIANGQIMLDSKRFWIPGKGDLGTTVADLVNSNPTAIGRWEVRLRMKTFESDAKDYKIRMELVPADPKLRCTANSITMAELSSNSRDLKVGVNDRKTGTAWTATKSGIIAHNSGNAYAVEVSSGHITWFRNAVAIATTKNKALLPGVPMTVRFSMVGDGTTEMNQTHAFSDWVRAWDFNREPMVKSGGPLVSSPLSGGC